MHHNYNQESFKKGEQFEKYVEEVIFPEAHYELLHKTSDSKQNIRRYARKSMEPDFQFKCRVSGKEFYIEAKWRAKPYKDKYEVLSASQFESFPKLHSDTVPIFIVFGYGGQAFKPDYLSLIPLNEIKATYLSPKMVNSFNIDKTFYPNENFIDKENQEQKKTVDPTTKSTEHHSSSHPNKKILGLAAIGIVVFLLGIYSFMSSSTSEQVTPEDKLQEVVADYYHSMNSNRIEKLPEFLSSNVESWYGAQGLSTSQIVKDAKNHRGTYPYSTTEINWETFKIIKQEDGDYIATYDMIYKRKKKINDDYKEFNLHLISTWNENFKMKSIREIEN